MKLLLLLLPAVALASLDVDLSGKINFEYQYLIGNVNAKGFVEQAITEYDKVAFQIEDENLKSAVEKYYGKKPDEVIIAGNAQVKIETDIPIDIFKMTSEKVILTQRIYENTHTEPKVIYIHESETKYDTVTSLWSNQRQVAASNVHIMLNLEVENNVASVNHQFAFGSNRRISHKKTRNQSGSINLAPRQKVLAQLQAKKGTVKFQVPYKISLSGNFDAYFNEEYNHENLHRFDLNLVLGNKTLTVYQVVSYEFYYGLSLQIVNPEDGYVLKSSADEGGLSNNQKRRASAAKHAAETGKKFSKKTPKVPIEFTEEDLKSIVEDVLENQLNDESNESSKEKTTEKS